MRQSGLKGGLAFRSGLLAREKVSDVLIDGLVAKWVNGGIRGGRPQSAVVRDGTALGRAVAGQAERGGLPMTKQAGSGIFGDNVETTRVSDGFCPEFEATTAMGNGDEAMVLVDFVAVVDIEAFRGVGDGDLLVDDVTPVLEAGLVNIGIGKVLGANQFTNGTIRHGLIVAGRGRRIQGGGRRLTPIKCQTMRLLCRGRRLLNW